MKKTLMVLSFALCASLAFAQTKTSVSHRSQSPMKATLSPATVQGDQQTGYNGSIFTKVGELMTCDFSVDNSGYSTGQLSSSDVVGGQAVSGHTQTSYHSTWHRMADTTTATITALRNAGNYSATFGTQSGFRSLHGFDSETPMAGIMVMTMQDQATVLGGHGAIGNFNAYMRFPSFATTGSAVVDVIFYQYYRCFNRDKNYIDYSTNGTTWNAVEINVRGVDVAVNSSLLGWLTTTLPLSTANQSTLHIRIRWASDDNVGNAYGYYWFIDDVKAVGGPANRLRVREQHYYEGFYQLMPKDLQLPMVWTCEFSNSGSVSQSNVTGKIFKTDVNGNTFTQAASKSAGNIAADATDYHTISIDPLSWYNDTTQYHGFGYYANPTSDPNVSLATASTGIGRVYSDVTSSAISHVYGDSATFDTVAYTVTRGNGTGNAQSYGNDGEGRVWGRDNGIIRKFSYWTYGTVPGDGGVSLVSHDPDEVLWSTEGYRVWVSYVTGNNIPQGWVIRGIELVASTFPGMAEAGAKISAELRADSTDGSTIWFRQVETGAGVHTVSSAELNNTANLEFLTNGNYNTVYIPFPEQPALQPGTSYRVGYCLEEDGFFSVAANGTYFYSLTDTSVVYFDSTQGLTQFGHTFGVANPYTIIVVDPQDNKLHWMGGSSPVYPMVRLVVGPAQVIPTYTITFQCDGNNEGYIMDNNYNVLCGTTETVAENSNHRYIIMPEQGYIVDKVFFDGQEVQYTVVEGDDGNYGVYEIQNITANHTLRASFLEDGNGGGDDPDDPNDPRDGINTANARVKMSLQPNPASSNVRLTISGVSGMVDFALIDMSGRVITSSKLNAEAAQTIDLSNVAKGAYFVRITNNNISKVEKLIVR
ncbi:MAG: T9SS type A sorting domain-containing protein [Bacteroidales bacterium]|nr:T9SS type A sorting domain-containing protein [Bacteroidales bacterium]